VALSLFGVTVNDGSSAQVKAKNIETVVVRDLAAICRPTDYRTVVPDEEILRLHTEVIAAYAAGGPILPAPVGVVFRSADSVRRWLELHLSTLSDALSFVENRVAARVHVRSRAEVTEDGIDLSTRAADSLRVLRRSAVATLPLSSAGSGTLLSAAFLVEQDLWNEFTAEVEAQGRIAIPLRFELTGPFPPYDFVHMQLGA
jgi:hypothetical protein